MVCLIHDALGLAIQYSSHKLETYDCDVILRVIGQTYKYALYFVAQEITYKVT
jgi:hypothetical protein